MKALITGINGQDGYFLAELLLSKGYTVVGLAHHKPSTASEIKGDIRIIECDLIKPEDVDRVIKTEKPDEIYNLAAVSDYAVYSKDPYGSHLVNGVAPVLIMEAMRKHCPAARMFQAGTCQAYGKPSQVPQDEKTPFDPVGAYPISKAFAHHMACLYRNDFGLYIVNGILYSHESVRRSEAFVTRKITKGVAAIKHGETDSITLGNLDARRGSVSSSLP